MFSCFWATLITVFGFYVVPAPFLYLEAIQFRWLLNVCLHFPVDAAASSIFDLFSFSLDFILGDSFFGFSVFWVTWIETKAKKDRKNKTQEGGRRRGKSEGDNEGLIAITFYSSEAGPRQVKRAHYHRDAFSFHAPNFHSSGERDGGGQTHSVLFLLLATFPSLQL